MIVTMVNVDSPAQRAGLRPGDHVIEAHGVAIHRVEDLVEVTRNRAGMPTVYRVRRGGEVLDPITITPVAEGGRGIIGITGQSSTRYVSAPLGRLAWISLEYPFVFTALQVRGIVEMVNRRTLEGLSGPPQMVAMVAEQAQQGFREYVQILFAISVALGFFNLLPIPALDGGRAVFLLVELVSRRKMNAKLETVAPLVGFVVLVSLIVFVSITGGT